MAINKTIHDRILDPYQKGFFSDNNNKYSNVILSHEANRILEVLDNDSVLEGLRIENMYLQNNDREIVVKVGSGRLVQDRTLVDIIESVNLVIPIFAEYDIKDVNTTDNYFVFSNDVTSDFETLTDFAVINSTGNDKNDWTVSETSYDSVSNETIVYVSGTIKDSTSDGKAICRKYIDSFETEGRIIIHTDYQFLEDFQNSKYPLGLKISYLDRDNHVLEGWNSSTNRLLLALIKFKRDSNNIKILNDSLERITMINDIDIEGYSYIPRKVTSIVDVADGGSINIENI